MCKILIINVLLNYLFWTTSYSQIGDKITQVTDTLINQSAPNFAVTTLQNMDYELLQLRDKIVVINFWYIGCAPCIKEIPHLNQLVAKYKRNKKIIFLAISVQGTKENISLFLKRKPFDYQIVASDFKIAKEYGVKFYPTNLVIDKNGKLAFAKAGYADNIQELLSEQIDRYLK